MPIDPKLLKRLKDKLASSESTRTKASYSLQYLLAQKPQRAFKSRDETFLPNITPKGHAQELNPELYGGKVKSFKQATGDIADAVTGIRTIGKKGYETAQKLDQGDKVGAAISAAEGLAPAALSHPLVGKLAGKAVGKVAEHFMGASDLPERYAIFTAENPGGAVGTPESNAAANAALKAELEAAGHKPVSVLGRYHDNHTGELLSENGFLVPNMHHDAAAALAKKYGQNGIVTQHGYHDLVDNKIFPSTGFGPSEAPPFTQLPSGEKFAHQIDWNNPLTPGGNPDLQMMARQFATRNGGTALPRVTAVDPQAAKHMASVYEKLPKNDKAAKAAYDQLNKEVAHQYNTLRENGYKFEFTNEDPYKSSKEMAKDVNENKRLKVFATQSDNFHPYMTPEQNNQFRAVHDVLAHAGEGNQFGPVGEENAYRTHASTLSPLAQRALATETRGQNSWVNFGPNAHLPAAERPFAEQKAALWPENLLGDYQGMKSDRGMTPFEANRYDAAVKTAGDKTADWRVRADARRLVAHYDEKFPLPAPPEGVTHDPNTLTSLLGKDVMAGDRAYLAHLDALGQVPATGEAVNVNDLAAARAARGEGRSISPPRHLEGHTPKALADSVMSNAVVPLTKSVLGGAQKFKDTPAAVRARIKKAWGLTEAPVVEQPKPSGLLVDRSMIRPDEGPSTQPLPTRASFGKRASSGQLKGIGSDEQQALNAAFAKRGMRMMPNTFYPSASAWLDAIGNAGGDPSMFHKASTAAAIRNGVPGELIGGSSIMWALKNGIISPEEIAAASSKDAAAALAKRVRVQYNKLYPGANKLQMMGAHMQALSNMLTGVDAGAYKIPMYGEQKLGNVPGSVIDTHGAKAGTIVSPYHGYFADQGGFSNPEYGVAERANRDVANNLGISDRSFQEAQWRGAGNFTGLKTVPNQDYAQIAENMVLNHARLRNISPQDAMKRVATGQEPLFTLPKKAQQISMFDY